MAVSSSEVQLQKSVFFRDVGFYLVAIVVSVQIAASFSGCRFYITPLLEPRLMSCELRTTFSLFIDIGRHRSENSMFATYVEAWPFGPAFAIRLVRTMPAQRCLSSNKKGEDVRCQQGPRCISGLRALSFSWSY